MAKRHITLPDSLNSLFTRLEEIILANSGENDFEEIFKLVLVKVWDEKNGEKIFGNLSDHQENLQNVNSVLSQIDEKWKSVLKEKHTRLNSTHLSLCLETIQAYELSRYSFESLDAFFENIVSKTSKGSKGQFFTPRNIIDFCVNIVNPKSTDSILDPTCGSGAFLLHANQNIENENSGLWGFDYDEKAVRIARALMYISGTDNFNIHQANSLLMNENHQISYFNNQNEKITTIEDYLKISKKEKKFDVILTNPPFAGEISDLNILSSYVVSKGKNKFERDSLFLERCVNLLKPGGRMAIILPDSKFGGRDSIETRKWLIKNTRVVGVIGLPNTTFMPHTSVKTSILFLEKREKLQETIQSEDIFFGISEKSGKDKKGTLLFLRDEEIGWDNLDHDLTEIEAEFKEFLIEQKIGW